MQLSDPLWVKIILSLEVDEDSHKIEQRVAISRGYTMINLVMYRFLSGQESLEPRLCIPECLMK